MPTWLRPSFPRATSVKVSLRQSCYTQHAGSTHLVQVLGLYRKREGARRMHEHGVFARFRYNDLKEAARDCGGRGPYANSMVGRSGVELCRGYAAERDR